MRRFESFSNEERALLRNAISSRRSVLEMAADPENPWVEQSAIAERAELLSLHRQIEAEDAIAELSVADALVSS